MLHQSLRLYRIMDESTEEELSLYIRSSHAENIPVHAPTYTWPGTHDDLTKLWFYYQHLIDHHLSCPLHQAVGHSLTTLQDTFSHSQTSPRQTLKILIIQLVSALLACCHDCHQDASLLLFLWRRYVHIDRVLGKGRVSQFLGQCFLKTSSPQNSLHVAYQYLIGIYTQKGYAHLLPLIEENFLAMQHGP